MDVFMNLDQATNLIKKTKSLQLKEVVFKIKPIINEPNKPSVM